jgi:iron complex outermembrane receptor protein
LQRIPALADAQLRNRSSRVLASYTIDNAMPAQIDPPPRGLMPLLRAARPAALLAAALFMSSAFAQEENVKTLEDVVVSASRVEQRRFDAPAAIDSVQVDPLRTASPLVNLSELLSAVPGVQARERQNYAQDLQLSVRGFGTRSTFGVRGVRILIDGIPATMPDGQGQVSNASLASASRIEVLRGPVAQLYGNAAGGVIQIFTRDPPAGGVPVVGLSAGAGSDAQRQLDLSVGGGTQTLGGLLDLSHYSTDGYRDHSAAERNLFNAKVVARPSGDTTVTGIFNAFNQPNAQDPLGLTRSAFESNPRQVVPEALLFDTRKRVEQQQAGIVLDHRLSADDTLNARIYAGTRQVFQTLAFSGGAPTSSGGVVDLDRSYGGVGLRWSHKTEIDHMPLRWTVGVEADRLRETRRGFVNNAGESGALRRDEDDGANNLDAFGQVDWTFAPRWQAIAGLRVSRVRFSVDDRFINASSPNDSGSVEYRNTSPVAGLVWHAGDNLNFYANVGRGFETPTLAESAYRAGGSGPNFSLQPSKSTQAEIGMKARIGRHALELALFDAESRDEIVPLSNTGGRAIFQNVDRVQRRGVEASWKAAWRTVSTRVGYTLLDARFKSAFASGSGFVASGNRLPGAPRHSLFADVEAHPLQALTVGLEMRADGKAYVDDANSDAAPGYAVFNLRAGHEYRAGPAKLYLFGRIDNLFDRKYAGSVIVNEANGRFFEPAPGRRLFVGVRSLF